MLITCVDLRSYCESSVNSVIFICNEQKTNRVLLGAHRGPAEQRNEGFACGKGLTRAENNLHDSVEIRISEAALRHSSFAS